MLIFIRISTQWEMVHIHIYCFLSFFLNTDSNLAPQIMKLSLSQWFPNVILGKNVLLKQEKKKKRLSKGNHLIFPRNK